MLLSFGDIITADLTCTLVRETYEWNAAAGEGRVCSYVHMMNYLRYRGKRERS